MKSRFFAVAVVGASLAVPFLSAETTQAQTKVFTLNTDFDVGAFNNSVDTNPNNQIVLGPTPVSKTTLVWATNYLYGWVVRINSLDGKQTSRFDSSLQFINGIATGAPPPNEYCDFASTGNCPGRVTVDTNGDVWIVNRAFGKQGTLSKFSGTIEHCIDRNNNGVIDTSFDANNDGQISVVAGAGEYFGQNDECILTTIKIGPTNQWPRGVAVDKRGKIWVSTFNDGKIYRYNPNEPVNLEATVTIAGANPYSLATGKDYLFVSNRGTGGVRRVHITTLAVQANTACGVPTYGVVGHPDGDIGYFGGWSGDGLYRANFTNNTCPKTATTGCTTAVTLDLAMNIWVANYCNHTVHKISPAGVLLGTYPAGGTSPHGLSVDFQGNIWVINHGPASVAKINANTGALIGTYTIGGPGVPNADPYLYSDFTGVQVDRQAPYTYVGSWEATHDGAVADMPWTKVAWNGEPQGAVPAETSLALSIRAANDTAALSVKPYTPVTNGGAVAGVIGRYAQVRAELKGPGFVTPALSDVTITGACAVVNDACCVQNSDCNDGDPCTDDACPGPGQVCIHVPKFECCVADGDCNDNNQCTADTCDLATNICNHVSAPNCCNSNSDCDDGVLCTADICSGAGGTCTNQPINGCCETNADCDDGNACTNDVCPPNNLCVHTPTPGCCTKDTDCTDANLCTIDACLPDGTCENSAVAGCCNVDPDCDDGDPCTNDLCSGPGGICQHSDKPGCCTPDDPMIGLPCDLPQPPFDQPPCAPGMLVCKNGQFDCEGGVKPGLEVCDGIDNDCNGVGDPAGSCPGAAVCIWGQCADPCANGEFPCPVGFQCYNGVCISADCTDEVKCPEGEVCMDGICQTGGGTGGGGSGAGGTNVGGMNMGGSGTGNNGQGNTGNTGHTGGGGTHNIGGASHAGGSTGSGEGNNGYGLATGAGGCRCAVPGTSDRSKDAGLALAALAFAFAASKRRRRN